MKYRDRIESLKKDLRREKLDALFIVKKENIIYLCGFDADGSNLIITSGDRDFIITDSRYAQKAKEELPDFKISLIGGSGHAALNNILKNGVKKLGFESDWLNYNDYTLFTKKLKKVDFIPKKYLVEKLRVLKDKEEIDLIRKSISIAKKAYSYARKAVNTKLNGQKLAILIDNFMRSEGAERPAFQTIVAQNPYSSHPHASATNRSFSKDSAVVVDMGAVFKGYNSDLTRVIFLDRITSKFKDIYNIIKTAQKKAIEKIRPGIKISELDRVARQYIANKGLGKYFLHNLGHGVGLEIHEWPRISKKNKDLLRPGMVFTVEPGIYIQGWGGIRLEDMVLVTKDRYEVLTDDIPK